MSRLMSVLQSTPMPPVRLRGNLRLDVFQVLCRLCMLDDNYARINELLLL